MPDGDSANASTAWHGTWGWPLDVAAHHVHNIPILNNRARHHERAFGLKRSDPPLSFPERYALGPMAVAKSVPPNPRTKPTPAGLITGQDGTMARAYLSLVTVEFEILPPDGRFLTDAAKQSVLSCWEQTKQDWRSGCLSGVGEPDADIVPWCDRINALPGLCTLQSCAGHMRGGLIEAAHLWIWMSESAAKNFDNAAFSLVRQRDRIDWVSKHYLHDGKEIASITFFGNERGLFEPSVSSVYDFMRYVSAAGQRQPESG